MAYIGNPPAEAYTNTVKDSFNGDGSTVAFTMSQPSVTNDVRVVVENVIQDPTVAYSCSGTTLTFTSAPPSGTNNIYVVHLGPAVMTTVPPSDIASATTFASNVTVQGAFTSQGIDDNATSTAMTLDTSGNLLVGTTSDYAENVQAAFYGASNGGISLASGTSGLSRLMFADGVAGTAGVYVGSIIYSHADDSLRFNVNGGTERMRILAGGGITFNGDTATANALDDYEEGTFAPKFIPNSSGSLPLQNAYDTMQYVKIGNWVTLSGFIRTTTPSSPVGSSPNLGNFPFTVANLSDAAGRSSGSVSYFDDSAGNWSVLPCYIVESQTQAYIQIDSSTIGANDGFYISLNYRTT